MKLWAGRFQKQTDELVNDFNASISFDQRLYEQDITGSMAHAQMLCDCGILTAQDNEKIQQGLTELLAEIEAGKVTFTADNEDIHMNVETLLTAKIGDAGKRLHTARSRNDQVALDFRLYLREEISSVIEKLLQMEKVLCEKAKAHTQTVMPGYTHLQRAQPITFAQHLLAYASMFTRDITRLEDCRTRMNECPLGSDVSHRPVPDCFGARLCRSDEKLARRRIGPRLRAGILVGCVDSHDAPEPVQRGNHCLVQLGV